MNSILYKWVQVYIVFFWQSLLCIWSAATVDLLCSITLHYWQKNFGKTLLDARIYGKYSYLSTLISVLTTKLSMWGLWATHLWYGKTLYFNWVRSSSYAFIIIHQFAAIRLSFQKRIHPLPHLLNLLSLQLQKTLMMRLNILGRLLQS